MDMNLTQFINNVRIKNAKTLLKKTNHTITKISLYVGFNDPNYFSNVFKKVVKSTPTEYRNHSWLKIISGYLKLDLYV